jgi:pimeloyl-ACP methyl ester carboxylesterase
MALPSIGPIDNKALLAKGAEKSLGAGEAETLRFVATNVTGGIVPDSGHWIMEENPQATIKLVTEFLAK